MPADEVRAGVELTNLDAELFDGAQATKRDLIDYLEATGDRLLAALRGRPLSVVRVRPGQAPFMQKNLPKYTPEWVPRVRWWAETSHRDIDYALCDDPRTLLWFGNQRAVEFHVPAVTAAEPEHPTHLVLDIDPPAGDSFAAVVGAAELVRTALSESGLAGAVKTSGAKGVHILIPVVAGIDMADAAAATRALAARAERLDPATATTAFIREDRHGKVFLDSTRSGGATLAAAFSPRIRPGTTVSFPVPWAALGGVKPGDFTIRSAAAQFGLADEGAAEMPEPQQLPANLVAEGHTIPVARVQAMHEGKRRARAKRAQS